MGTTGTNLWIGWERGGGVGKSDRNFMVAELGRHTFGWRFTV